MAEAAADLALLSTLELLPRLRAISDPTTRRRVTDEVHSCRGTCCAAHLCGCVCMPPMAHADMHAAAPRLPMPTLLLPFSVCIALRLIPTQLSANSSLFSSSTPAFLLHVPMLLVLTGCRCC